VYKPFRIPPNPARYRCQAVISSRKPQGKPPARGYLIAYQSLTEASFFDAAGRKVGTRPAALAEKPEQYETAVVGFMEHLARFHRTPYLAADSTHAGRGFQPMPVQRSM